MFIPYASPRLIPDARACYFYHTMDIPDHGTVRGEWDLRGREATYLGNVAFAGKSILEIGTASGHLCFWMEGCGGHVTAYDLDATRPWDLVPYYGADAGAGRDERRTTLERLNNSWWFTHAKRKSRARCLYGSVYELSSRHGDYDVVTLGSILLHLRDPITALERACARARSEIVITDVSESQFLATKPHLQTEACLHFLPRMEHKSPLDSWYFLPSVLVVEVLKVFGFPSTQVTRHTQRFKDGHDWQFYTVVGRRSPL